MRPKSCINSVKKVLLIITLLGACLSEVSQEAEAQDALEPKRLKNQAEVSAVSTIGNTDILTLSFRNVLTYDFSRNSTVRWDLYVLYGEQDKIKSAERYSTDLRGDHKLSARYYAYLLGGWLRDEFAGYRNRYYTGPGIGRSLIDDHNHLFVVELGANLTREEYVTGVASDFLESRLFGGYEYAFSEGNQFMQSLEYLHDLKNSSNYKVLSKTSLTSALTEILAMRFTYEIRYQNRPLPDSLEKTDTTFSGSLVWTY